LTIALLSTLRAVNSICQDFFSVTGVYVGVPLYKAGSSPPIVNSLPDEASLKAETPLAT